MRKSNWIILGVLVIASILFLVLWKVLDFDRIHNLDLILSIVWWVLVVGICVAIHVVEERRRRTIRTAFLAPGLIYNPEAGIVRLSSGGGQNLVSELYGVLEELDYSLAKPDTPTEERIRFDYIVHSDKFNPSKKVWEGEVVDIAHRNRVRPFSSREELERILPVETTAA